MNIAAAKKELAVITERAEFLRAVIESAKQKAKAAPYGCQEYSADRLCRFDRRAIDRKCDGCQRTTDREYLAGRGLWVEGVSHGQA